MLSSTKELLRFMEGNDKNFIIPVYQRNYEWEEAQCKQLLNDIKRIPEHNLKNYFIGAIVSIDENRDDILIIDGQQRLTTVSLLLLAIYNLLDSGTRRATNITKEQIKNEYLINQYAKDSTKKIKLKPIKNDDKDYYRLFDNNNEIENTSSKIIKNYIFLKKELVKENLDVIFSSIQKLIIVDIELKINEDNPQLIFESLNSTGLALDEADKIRNFMLMDEEADIQEKYYTTYWQEIEKNTLFISDKKTTSYTNKFIRDYLSYKTRTIPNENKVYIDFKEYYFKNITNNKEELLKELYQFSKYYNYILEPIRFRQDEDIRLLLMELKVMDMKVFNVVLLELFDDLEHEVISIQNLKDILKTSINYIFRRHICGVPTNSLKNLLVSLLRDIKKKEDYSADNYVDIFNYVLIKKTYNHRFPNNDEVKDTLTLKSVYKDMKKYKFYLLGKLENYENNEPVNIEDESKNSKPIQIEHIIPQTMTNAWRKELGEEWEDIHSKYLHTLGNLTLTGYNPRMKNYSFSKKKKIGFNDSRLFLNQFLNKIDVFNEAIIKKRSQMLIERVIKIWDYPTTNYSPPISEVANIKYSLEDDEDFTGKQIISFNICGEGEKPANSWKHFYVESIKYMIEYNRGYFETFQDECGERFIGKDKNAMRMPKNIGNEIYIETRYSANQLLIYLRKLVNLTEDFELSDFQFEIEE